MQGKLVSGSVLILALLSTVALYAQECGQPDFACSGTMTCECNGQWECAGTECALPPPNYECPDGSYLQCTGSGWQCVSQGSPIIIDTKGEGYHLTSLDGGVKFAFFPGKPPVQMSWTDSAYSNGFLVLDRNGDGVINDGSELFGTETPQPSTSHPNGFNALAVYDLPANGGNGNGVIDPGDAIWPKLRIWIDINHDGTNEPGELHTLNEFGITSISLKYHSGDITDQYGNWFRYSADYTNSAGNERDRLYDIMLWVEPPSGAATVATSDPAIWTVAKGTLSFERIQLLRVLQKVDSSPALVAALSQASPQAPRWGYDANLSRSGSVISIHASGPRPMRDVVQALSQEYGWSVDYEDPVYRLGSDTSDATAPDWREKHPTEKGLVGVRGGDLVASYNEKANPPDSSQSELGILKSLVDSYTGSGLPEGFKIEAEDSSHFAVVGITSGSGNATHAFLDTPVFLPSQPMSADQAIQKVLDAASAASGVPAVTSSGPFYFSAAMIVPSGARITARNQLRRILDAVGSARYYWLLLFDPNTGTYHFNVAPVVKKVASPDGHVMLMRVPR